LDTRVKISEMRRCWMLVSCRSKVFSKRSRLGKLASGAYQLGVELGQSGLTLAVEDQEGVNHRGREVTAAVVSIADPKIMTTVLLESPYPATTLPVS
jgi:hypothetical protein